MPRKKRKASRLARLVPFLVWSAPPSVNGWSRQMIYRFADCELDEQLYQLRRTGVPVALEPKVFDVLAYLLQHRDRVVSNDELLDKLWPGQVVGENALTRCIRAARAAVGDDGTKQAIIETQRGRGYRFIGEVVSRQPSVVSREEEAQKPILVTIAGANGESNRESSLQSLASNGQQLESRVQSPESEEQRLSITGQTLDVVVPPRSWPRGRLMWLGVLVLITVSAVVFALFSIRTPLSTIRTQEALSLPDKPSLIVLPFVNLSGDPGQEYFSDGVTTDITNTLAQLSSLFVISRMSAFTYKNKSATVRDISREMGVQYVLEGSVRKTDDQLRIAVALVDATTDRQLWAEQYDRPVTNIFAVQDEIVQRIVTTLNLQLTLWEKGVVVRKRTNVLEAYDFYLRGMDFMWRAAYEAKKELNTQAQQLFGKAIELDPYYAEAYAQLGITKWNDWFYVWDSPQALEQAFQAEKTAIALDDSLALAHTMLGQVYVWRKQHEQAVHEARRAVALAPNDANSHANLGNILTFAGGDLNQAIKLIEQAMRLNPRYPPMYLLMLSIAYRVAGRCVEALAPLQRAVALAPNYIQARVNLAICYVEVDRLPEAQAEVAEIRRLNPAFTLAWMAQRLPYKDQTVTERMVAALRKAGME